MTTLAPKLHAPEAMDDEKRDRVLHIVPDSAGSPHHAFLGSTKDTRSRTEYFETRGIPVDRLPARQRNDGLLLEDLKKMDLGPYRWALFELTLYPQSVRYLREHAPHIRIVTRAMNAEAIHQVHLFLAKGLRRKGLKADLNKAKWRLDLDRTHAKLSHDLISITEWEADNYWRYLTRRDKIKVAPYFLLESDEYVPPPGIEKKTQCVCMMSTSLNPFLLDTGKKFTSLVGKLGQDLPEWEFAITGDCPPDQIPLPPRVRPTGILDTPFEILAESRAVALLSDYGFGFKTKILEAIRCKCWILMGRKLYGRLPREVQPFCIVVDVHSADSFKAGLKRCTEPYPEGDPNVLFREQSYKALDEVFCPLKAGR